MRTTNLILLFRI